MNHVRGAYARRHQYMHVSQFSAFDLNSFHTLHDRFAPMSAPNISEIECYARCARRSRALAGDFFFLVRSSARELVIAVGSVALPGAAGFIAVTGLAAGIQSLAARGGEPRDIVEEANRIFWEITSESAFAPLFCARIDAARRRLVFTHAGDQTCLVMRGRDRKLQVLESNAPMLGLCLDGACAQREVTFEPGDTLLTMTEGIAESVPAPTMREAMLLRTRDIPCRLMEVSEGKTTADRAVVAARLKDPETERPHFERKEQLVVASAA